jgi:hypothetical protein
LQYRKCSKITRRVLTTLFTFLVCAVSVMGVYLSILSRSINKSLENACSHTTINHINNTSPESDIECFCQLSEISSVEEYTLCRKANINDMSLRAIISSILVVCINVATNFSLKRLSSWEKHKSIISEGESISSRIFLLQFINTALVTLIVHFKIETFGNFSSGIFTQLSVNWYSVVGVKIFLSMFFSTFTPHLVSGLLYLTIFLLTF